MKLALVLLALLAGAGPAPAKPSVVYAWFPHVLDPRLNEDWSTEAIDWRAITHLCVRAVTLQPDGSLAIGWGTTPERIRKVVDEAHSHRAKVTILAWGTNPEGSSRYPALFVIGRKTMAFLLGHNS